jgi:WD40 repeat protein
MDGLCPACVLAVVIEPPRGLEKPAGFGPGAARTEPVAGLRRFGDYELLDEIARGGMGVVYRARQVSLNRVVAVKMILWGHFASKESVRRFRAEAETAARLQHPNIVAIHEIGEWEGQHFFSMDCVEGASLDKSGPLPAEHAARYLEAIADAVHYAHGRGVLHRDLKPSNVLIDAFDQPRVTDFGLAKLLHLDSGLTVTGQALGSPQYMPPEQASAGRGEVGPRSDLYALGALLYHCLTGRPPFAAATVAETLAQVLDREPVAPRVLNPAVPRDLEAICLKCLEKDPARRYATASELAEELGCFRRGEPIRARPIGATGRLWRWSQRKPALAAMCAALAVAVALGFAGVLWQWGRAERHALNENIERGRAEAALGELELERAEDLLRNDQPNAAVAWLAHSLRRQPDHAVAAQRLVAALDQFSFALPSVAPLIHTGAVAWAEFSPDGSHVVTASLDGSARLWHAASGRSVGHALAHGRAVRVARFSPDGRLIATAAADQLARFWRSENGEPLESALVHEGPVTYLEFSADGRQLLTVADDRLVSVWAVPEGRLVGKAIPHRSRLSATHFSPDGRRLLTATRSGATRVWESETGAPVTPELQDPTLAMFSARFSPDGSRVASAYDPNGVTIRDAATGRTLGQLRQHGGSVHDAVFSSDGHWLVTISRDGTARVWDARTLAARGEPLQHRAWVMSAEFSADGQRLLTTGLDHTARVWDLIRWRPLIEPIHVGGNILHARFSPEGSRVVTASQSGVAQIWDTRPGRAAAMALSHSSGVPVVRFSHDGRRVLTGTSSGVARVWNAATCRPLISLRGHERALLGVAFSPDDGRIVTASWDATAVVWDARTGRRLARWTNQTGRIFSPMFSPDGRNILSSSFDATVWVWDAATGRPVVGPLKHRGRVWHAEFSPDGKRIVAAAGVVNQSGELVVWDSQSGRRLYAWPHSDEVHWATFSPDGNNVVSASADHTACILDARSGQLRHSLAHEAMVLRAVFSPGGATVATTCRDQTARLWHVQSGTPLSPPMRHAEEIVSVRFSQDGRLLATASLDRTARVWDVATGKLLAGPFRHADQVRDVDFSPDGRWLVTASNDGTARLWELPPAVSTAPSWLPALAEATGGLRLDERRVLQAVPTGAMHEAVRRLEHEQESGELVRWARWLLADRSTRHVSGRSQVTLPDFVECRVNANAIPSLTEALEFQPTNGLALARLARSWLNRGPAATTNAASDAARLLDWAMRQSPDQFEVWWGRAELLERNGDLHGAAAAMARARETQPAEVDFWMADGALLERLGRYDEACAAFSRALTNAGLLAAPPLPAQFRALLRRGAAHRAAGRDEEAASDLLMARSIPARAAGTSSNCVDLSLWYNAPLHQDWHTTPVLAGYNLSRVTPGPHVLGGVEFDVRGVIQLAGAKITNDFPEYPREVRGVRVQRHCRALHFLHASIWTYKLSPGTRIGGYLVEYLDGQKEEIPLLHGEDMLEWQVINDRVEALKNATVVWTGRTPHNRPVRLFKRTWENQRPDAAIASFDFLSTMTDGAPFLIAVSVEP